MSNHVNLPASREDPGRYYRSLPQTNATVTIVNKSTGTPLPLSNRPKVHPAKGKRK